MNTLFQHPNKITLEQENSYFVFDNKSEERTDFVTKENEEWTLHLDVKRTSGFIDNERFIMNDAGVGIKKCDWICFNQVNFYFIEAKNVKTKKRSEAKKDFDKKMQDTLSFYQQFNLEELKKHAILNFNSPNKITGAATKDRKYKYKEIGINYEELNYLEVI